MSDERIKAPTTSDNSLAPALSYFGNKTRVKIDGKTVYIYIYGKSSNKRSPSFKRFSPISASKSEEVYQRLHLLDAPL